MSNDKGVAERRAGRKVVDGITENARSLLKLINKKRRASLETAFSFIVLLYLESGALRTDEVGGNKDKIKR